MKKLNDKIPLSEEEIDAYDRMQGMRDNLHDV